MNIQQVFLVIWARRRVATALLVLTVLTALVVSLVVPKEYTASATVVIDVQTPDRIVGMVLPGMMSPGYMATQLDIINSERVAQRVVKLLKLEESPIIREQWREETDGKGSVAEWLAPLLQKSLVVEPARESNVVEIQFSGQDPGFSAAVANAFAQAYIDTTIELRAEPARKYATWFEEQVQMYRGRLEKAQKALSDFQQRSGIVATEERLDFENQKLGELTAQLSLAQAEGTDSSSKQELNTSNDTLPEVMRNPLIIQLKGDVARLESKLKELSVDYGVNHPRYKNASAELTAMKAKLRSETGKIAEAIHTVGEVSQVKIEELKLAIAQQKQTMLEIKGQRDQITLLSREVDTAQRDFDAISQRLTQSRLEAQTVQTNVSILTSASVPLEHSKPILMLNLAVGVFLGGLLAIGTALALEILKPIVRSKADLSAALSIPVLAQLDDVSIKAKRKQKKPHIHTVTTEVGA
ncbi:MAG: chain length determinant protein EpsF [Pseudomonadales bacterium]|nr:chain length determinant protein EpsF [Pseudomonadales bacterium]